MNHKKFLIGLDIGQSQDPSALTIIECVPRETLAAVYHMRFLRRLPLQMSYPDVLTSVRTIVERPEIAHNCALLVDTTGVGAPIVDILREMKLPCKLVPVLVTFGTAVTHDGKRYHVPKRNLATATKILLDEERLKISPLLEDHKLLVRELQAFRVKITKKANDTYEAWREGDHDDLVFATAMCCWYAERKAKKILEGEKVAPQTDPVITFEKVSEVYEKIVVQETPVVVTQEGWSWNDAAKYGRTRF